jgi:hypothetical protein
MVCPPNCELRRIELKKKWSEYAQTAGMTDQTMNYVQKRLNRNLSLFLFATIQITQQRKPDPVTLFVHEIIKI